MPGGVVYHASYLAFAERARTEVLRDAGIAHAELAEAGGLMFMVRRSRWSICAPRGSTICSRWSAGSSSSAAATVTLRQDVLRERPVSIGTICV